MLTGRLSCFAMQFSARSASEGDRGHRLSRSTAIVGKRPHRCIGLTISAKQPLSVVTWSRRRRLIGRLSAINTSDESEVSIEKKKTDDLDFQAGVLPRLFVSVVTRATHTLVVRISRQISSYPAGFSRRHSVNGKLREERGGPFCGSGCPRRPRYLYSTRA
jgi:hypothetical protein